MICDNIKYDIIYIFNNVYIIKIKIRQFFL